jgi:hypothetical protein
MAARCSGVYCAMSFANSADEASASAKSREMRPERGALVNVFM